MAGANPTAVNQMIADANNSFMTQFMLDPNSQQLMTGLLTMGGGAAIGGLMGGGGGAIAGTLLGAIAGLLMAAFGLKPEGLFKQMHEWFRNGQLSKQITTATQKLEAEGKGSMVPEKIRDLMANVKSGNLNDTQIAKAMVQEQLNNPEVQKNKEYMGKLQQYDKQLDVRLNELGGKAQAENVVGGVQGIEGVPAAGPASKYYQDNVAKINAGIADTMQKLEEAKRVGATGLRDTTEQQKALTKQLEGLQAQGKALDEAFVSGKMKPTWGDQPWGSNIAKGTGIGAVVGGTTGALLGSPTGIGAVPLGLGLGTVGAVGGGVTAAAKTLSNARRMSEVLPDPQTALEAIKALPEGSPQRLALAREYEMGLQQYAERAGEKPKTHPWTKMPFSPQLENVDRSISPKERVYPQDVDAWVRAGGKGPVQAGMAAKELEKQRPSEITETVKALPGVYANIVNSTAKRIGQTAKADWEKAKSWRPPNVLWRPSLPPWLGGEKMQHFSGIPMWSDVLMEKAAAEISNMAKPVSKPPENVKPEKPDITGTAPKTGFGGSLAEVFKTYPKKVSEGMDTVRNLGQAAAKAMRVPGQERKLQMKRWGHTKGIGGGPGIPKTGSLRLPVWQRFLKTADGQIPSPNPGMASTAVAAPAPTPAQAPSPPPSPEEVQMKEMERKGKVQAEMLKIQQLREKKNLIEAQSKADAQKHKMEQESMNLAAKQPQPQPPQMPAPAPQATGPAGYGSVRAV